MKKAFTLLELVFVIVVIGILAVAIIPSTRSNPLQEAATQLLSHIRYTQHLSMVNDKFDANDADWYKKRWQLIFGKSTDSDGKIAYTIFSDNKGTIAGPNGNPNTGEIAKDPMSSEKLLSGGYSGSLATSDYRANKKMNLGLSYRTTTVTMGGACSGGCDEFGGACSGDLRISFDHLGRPIRKSLKTYTSAYKTNRLLEAQCTITLGNATEDNVTIAIEPETGYAHILL